MKVIFLGGSGDLGDFIDTIDALNRESNSKIEGVGFLDDSPSPTRFGLPYLGKIDEAKKMDSNYCFINTIGSSSSYKIVASLIEKSEIVLERFLTLIHPSAVISSQANVGKGCVLLAHVSVGAGVKIGNHVKILQNTVVSHAATIEDFVAIGSNVSISGNCAINRSCYIGSHASLIGGITIGNHAMVGMGSVVLKDVPPSETWVGNPARVLKRS